jgi:hypothetical protein
MSPTRTRRTRPRTYVKDTISYLGGWGLIIHQVAFVPRGDFNLWPLVMGGILVGVPGFGQMAPYIGRVIARALDTGSGQSASPPEESPPPSPRSSPGPEAEQ